MATFQYRTKRVPPVNLIRQDGNKIMFRHGSSYVTSDERDITFLENYVKRGYLSKKPVDPTAKPVPKK